MTEPANNAEPVNAPARRFGLDDGLLVAGAVLLSAGGYLAWRPLAFFIPGAICLALGFLIARAR